MKNFDMVLNIEAAERREDISAFSVEEAAKAHRFLPQLIRCPRHTSAMVTVRRRYKGNIADFFLCILGKDAFC